MFKVEDFFDLELEDDFFQDAFNVTSKTSTQKSVSAGSAVLFNQSGLEKHSTASKDNHQKLSEVEAGNDCDKARASGSLLTADSSVLQNKINLPTYQLHKRQPSSGITTAKHNPLTDSRQELSTDSMGLQYFGAATSVADISVDKDSEPFPKASLSKDAKSGNQKKLPFISYDDEDLSSVFSFESMEECSTVNKAVENRTLKSAKPQQSVSRKYTQHEGNSSGKESPFSARKYASPLPKERTASDTSGDFNSNSLLRYNTSELDTTPTSGVNMLAMSTTNKVPNRPQCVKKTPTVDKIASPFNSLSPGVNSNMHLNQSTPRNKCASVTRKRKFPGPAGILPELPPGADLSTFSEPESPIVSVSPKDAAPQDFVCSQSLVDEFEKQPWQMMLKDVTCKGSTVMDNFNISWVLRQASSKQLPKGKVPVLCIILKNISLQGSEARVTFADKTGEMNGMIHGKLLEEYQDKLQPGAVLVLKQVTVFSPSARKHYLVITPSNIISLYGVLGDKTSVIAYNGSQLMAMAEEWAQEAMKGPRISSGSMQLLSSNSLCLRAVTPSRPHVGLQRLGNSTQQWSGEKISPKQTPFAAVTSVPSKENQEDNTVFHNSVTGGSHNNLNPSLCSSRNKKSPETVTAGSADVQMAETVNSNILDNIKQESPALGTAVSKTGGDEEESAVFEDEFDDLFSNLDEDALLSEKW